MSKKPSISYQLRQQEQWVGFFLCMAIAWVNVIHVQTHILPWLVSLLAMGVAAWARQYPASGHEWLALRGYLLVVAGLFLPLSPGIDGVDNFYFVWPFATVCLYSLLLPRFMASTLLGLSLAGLLLVLLLQSSIDGWHASQIILLGLLLIFGTASIRLGHWIQLLDQRIEIALTDRRTGTYNEFGLLNHGESLLLACRHRGVPITLVLLDCRELREIPDLMGRTQAQKMLMRLVKTLRSTLPQNTLLARAGSTRFAALVPSNTFEQVETLLHEAWGDPPRIPLKTRQYNTQLSVELLMATPSGKLESLETLYKRLLDELDRLHERDSLTSKGAATETDSGPPSSLLAMTDDFKHVHNESDPSSPLKYRFGRTKATTAPLHHQATESSGEGASLSSAARGL